MTVLSVPCAGLPVAVPFCSYQVVVAAILFPFAKDLYIYYSTKTDYNNKKPGVIPGFWIIVVFLIISNDYRYVKYFPDV